MTKCPRQPKKKRVSKPHKGRKSHGNPSDYKTSVKGHRWVGKGDERHCELCGKRPKRFSWMGIYEVRP